MPPRKSKSKSKSKGSSSDQGERHLRKKQNDKLRGMQAAGVQGLSAVIDPSLSAATETVAATAPQRVVKRPDEQAKGKSNSTEWEAVVRQAFVERKAAHKGLSMSADAIVKLDEAQQAEVEKRFQAWLAGKEEKAKAAQKEKEAAVAAKAAAELEERRHVLNYEMARRVHVYTAQQRGESLSKDRSSAMMLNAREEAEVKRLVKARLAIPDLKPGTCISTGVLSYTIDKDQDAKLKGGQGRIYKGYVNGENGEKYYFAIKSQMVLGKSDMRREADIYFRLVFGDFPNLSLLSDVLVHPLSKDKVPLLVTEWAEHGTLSAWMDKHVVKLWGGWEGRSAAQRAKLCKLYLPKVLAVAVQMARGLASLHGLKPLPLVHQDAKPGNVLMYSTERGMPKGVPVVKFADFGMCGASNEFGAHLGGTRTWMSPEQMGLFMSAMEGRARKGEAVLDPSFDLWALGLMLAYIFGPATRGALEEYQRWLRGEYDLGAAAGEMAGRAQAIVSSAEAECEALRGADERVGEAWEAMVCVLKACLGEGRLEATAGDCEELLQQSYELLSSDGGRFGKVKLSSMQAAFARDRNEAFRPKELQAVFDEKVLGNWRTSRALLLEQVAIDLRLPQTSGGGGQRTEREVLQALLKALPHRRKYDARLLPLAMDVVRNLGSLYTLEEEDCVLVVAIGEELQRQWQRSNNKEICSRRLGATSDSNCPFLCFSKQGLGRVVRGMLEACGADDKARQALLRVEDKKKWTALHLACQYGNVKVAEALLAACGADDKARQALLRAEGKHKATPLHYACEYGHVKVAEALLAACGADEKARQALLRAEDKDKFTPLHCACQYGHVKVAEALLAACGADDKARQALLRKETTDKATPLYLACQQSHVKVAEALLAACGADDRARQVLLGAEKNLQKATPLHIACLEGHVKVVEALLATCGADDKARQALLRVETKHKTTPLHLSCLEGHVKVVEALLAACGADDKARQALLRMENKDKGTPLHIACGRGHVKVVEALFAACGADDKARQALLRAEGEDKGTPLHIACLKGHVKVAEALLAQAGSHHERMRMLTANAVEVTSPSALARVMGHTALAERLEAMCQVEAHSLSGATHLNGKVGRVVGLQGEELLGVDFGPPLGVKALRPRSLRWLRERLAAVGGEGGVG